MVKIGAKNLRLAYRRGKELARSLTQGKK